MVTCETLLALLLLTSPPNHERIEGEPPTSADPPEALLTCLGASLTAWSLSAEILDLRELPAGYHAETLRRRYDDLRNAPALAECERFPERPFIEQSLALNRTYRNHLTARLALDSLNAEAIQGAICDTDSLYAVYDCLRDILCPHYYVNVRRTAMIHLRGVIGDEAFLRGVLPPSVPLRHLPRQ